MPRQKGGKNNRVAEKVKADVHMAEAHMREARRAVELAIKELRVEIVSLRKTVDNRTEPYDKLQAEIVSLRSTLDNHSERYDKLQASIVKTLTFLFQLLDDPDAKHHAKAVADSYFFEQRRTEEDR